MTLKFELDKLNLVLVQNKIFLSLTYFDKFLMAVLQLAVWKVAMHVEYVYIYKYRERNCMVKRKMLQIC